MSSYSEDNSFSNVTPIILSPESHLLQIVSSSLIVVSHSGCPLNVVVISHSSCFLNVVLSGCFLLSWLSKLQVFCPKSRTLQILSRFYSCFTLRLSPECLPFKMLSPLLVVQTQGRLLKVVLFKCCLPSCSCFTRRLSSE